MMRTLISVVFLCFLLTSCLYTEHWTDYYEIIDSSEVCNTDVVTYSYYAGSVEKRMDTLFDSFETGEQCKELIADILWDKLDKTMEYVPIGYMDKLYEAVFVLYHYPIQLENYKGEEKVLRVRDYTAGFTDCILNPMEKGNSKKCNFFKGAYPMDYEESFHDTVPEDRSRIYNKGIINYILNRYGMIVYQPVIRGKASVNASYQKANRMLTLSDNFWPITETNVSPFVRAVLLLHEARHAEIEHVPCNEKEKKDGTANCDAHLDGSYGVQIQYLNALMNAEGAHRLKKQPQILSKADVDLSGEKLCTLTRIKLLNEPEVKLEFSQDISCNLYRETDYLKIAGSLPFGEDEKPQRTPLSDSREAFDFHECGTNQNLESNE
ncbi:MAG: hypothetical protein CL678_10950 [Bdellovibrionaceae bacterium]|nr:hypothetical protein [Pseudobdellovibrionaceae bacterium]